MAYYIVTRISTPNTADTYRFDEVNGTCELEQIITRYTYRCCSIVNQ